MSQPEAADVAIVGNGMVALTLARALKNADPALDIVIVGPSDREGGASAAAGAMLGCYGEVTAPAAASRMGRLKHQLAKLSAALWPELLQELATATAPTSLRQVRGTYIILNGRSGSIDSANFKAIRDELLASGEKFEDVDEVPGVRAVPDARPLRALFLPDEGAVDARQVLRAMERATAAQGIRSVDTTVSRIVTNGDSVGGVLTARGDLINAGHVVVAAGAFSGPLLSDALGPGVIQPIFAGSGVSLSTERVMGRGFDNVVRSVNRAGSCGLHVVPLGGGVEYFGATNVIFGTPEIRPHLGVWHFVADCAMRQLDQDVCYSRVVRTHIGNRPVPLDTFPLIGSAGIDGLSVATGTYRDGFHCAPRIAQLMAAHILSGQQLTDFDPLRHPAFELGVEESIDAFTEQCVSGAYEGGTLLSPFIDSEALGDIYRPMARALHETLGMTDRGLPTDIVDFLTRSRKTPADVEHVRRYLGSLEPVTSTTARSDP